MVIDTQLNVSLIDKDRLIAALDRALGSWTTYAPYLEFFHSRLRGSQPVPPQRVPDDVITMNSRFAVRDDQTGEIMSYTLVYPEDEAPHDGKLSALSPMGMALYGARVGEEVCWMSSTGPQVATVKELHYQPEAAGHLDR